MILQPRDRKAAAILLTVIAFVVAVLSAVTIHDSSEAQTIIVCGAVAAASGVATMTGFLNVAGVPLSRAFVWSPFFILVFMSLIALIATWSGEIDSFALALFWACMAVLIWIAYSSEQKHGEPKSAQPGSASNAG